VEWINPAARSIFHCSGNEVVGRPASLLIPMLNILLPEEHEVAPDGMVAAQLPRLATEGRRRDGSAFPLELAVVRLRTDGPRTGMCVCRDNTDALRLERVKSEFVSMVSHELRTPLTSLRGSLALLADGSIAGLPNDARRLLALASGNAERLVMLVNDILDYEKLRAGALSVDNDAADLVELARRAIESLEGMARPNGVQMVLHARDEEVPVLADAARAMQVIVNLLSNAIKYSPPEGLVSIRVRRRQERARLTVQDSGPGVDPEFVPRLFKPFEQARDPRHRKQGGTGLGMAISQELMQMMHGAIGIEPPVLGQGAEFWIELPLNSARPSTFGDLV
jgi:signal transduction histidine kinase